MAERRPRINLRGWASGFTLIEILVVVAIIVLMIGMAVPLFNTLTGSRSEESAENQVAAMLNTARTEAMALQVPGGVLFYVDPVTTRVNAALVREVRTDVMDDPSAIDADVEIILDLMDREPVMLPPGIAMQMIDNAEYPTGVAKPTPEQYTDDRYVGFERISVPSTPESILVGGVILFDGRGQLIARRYAFPRASQVTEGASPPKTARTAAAQLFYPNADAGFLDKSLSQDPVLIQRQRGSSLPAWEKNMAPRSGYGLVLFNREAFLGAGNDEADPQFDGGTYDTAEKDEEKWIDGNSVPLIVNRYNGTLIRGEP